MIYSDTHIRLVWALIKNGGAVCKIQQACQCSKWEAMDMYEQAKKMFGIRAYKKVEKGISDMMYSRDETLVSKEYRGFKIVQFKYNSDVSYMIYKDQERYSKLQLVSIEVACKIIDKHLGKDVQQEKVIAPNEEWKKGIYTNNGYLNLIK